MKFEENSDGERKREIKREVTDSEGSQNPESQILSRKRPKLRI